MDTEKLVLYLILAWLVWKLLHRKQQPSGSQLGDMARKFPPATLGIGLPSTSQGLTMPVADTTSPDFAG